MAARCRRAAIPAALAGAALLAGGCGPAAPPDGPPPPLVLLVSLDTLRADRLPIYGYARDTAPHLRALADEGVVFETVLAQASQTLVSHKSLFTARYPLRLVAETTGAGLRDLAADDRFSRRVSPLFGRARGSLVTALRDAGWRTAAFTDGAWMRRAYGFDEGFEHFDERGGHLEALVPRALAWLAEQADDARPRFVFLHAYDTHCPYVSRAPYDTAFCREHDAHLELADQCPKPQLLSRDLSARDFRAISDHYDGGVLSADAWLGELFAGLRAAGLWEEAALLVTSDHGETLGEHDLVGHGGLTLEQLRVPLVLKLPRSWGAAGRRVEAPAALLDVMPTLLDVAGVPVPEGIDGRSLLPLLGRGAPARPYLVAQTTFREGRTRATNLAKRAVLDPGRWLLIHDARRRTTELYDLGRDPSGATPATDADAPGDPLRAALGAADPVGGGGPLQTDLLDPAEDPELQAELRALGYVE